MHVSSAHPQVDRRGVATGEPGPEADDLSEVHFPGSPLQASVRILGRARPLRGSSFRRCRFEEHFSFCADYVGWTFEGRIRTAVFHGRAPDGTGCDGKVNQIVRNDFTHALLTDNVDWRGSIDLSAQSWPDGYAPVVRPGW